MCRSDWILLNFAFLVPIVSVPFQRNLLFGQFYILLLLLIAAGCWSYLRGYRALAGALVAIAAVCKVFPLILFVFFLQRRDWRALSAGVATGIAASAVSIAAYGWNAHRTWLLQIFPWTLHGEGIQPYVRTASISTCCDKGSKEEERKYPARRRDRFHLTSSSMDSSCAEKWVNCSGVFPFFAGIRLAGFKVDGTASSDYIQFCRGSPALLAESLEIVRRPSAIILGALETGQPPAGNAGCRGVGLMRTVFSCSRRRGKTRADFHFRIDVAAQRMRQASSRPPAIVKGPMSRVCQIFRARMLRGLRGPSRAADGNRPYLDKRLLWFRRMNQ